MEGKFKEGQIEVDNLIESDNDNGNENDNDETIKYPGYGIIREEKNENEIEEKSKNEEKDQNPEPEDIDIDSIEDNEQLQEYMHAVKEAMEEVYEEKLASKEEEKNQEIELLVEQINELERENRQLKESEKHLKMNQHSNTNLEQLEDNLKKKFKNKENELFEKFQYETENYMIAIQKEMEDIIRAKLPSKEQKQAEIDSLRQEIRDEISKEFQQKNDLKAQRDAKNMLKEELKKKETLIELNLKAKYQRDLQKEKSKIEENYLLKEKQLKDELENQRNGLGRQKSAFNIKSKNLKDLKKQMENSIKSKEEGYKKEIETLKEKLSKCKSSQNDLKKLEEREKELQRREEDLDRRERELEEKKNTQNYKNEEPEKEIKMIPISQKYPEFEPSDVQQLINLSSTTRRSRLVSQNGFMDSKNYENSKNFENYENEIQKYEENSSQFMDPADQFVHSFLQEHNIPTEQVQFKKFYRPEPQAEEKKIKKNEEMFFKNSFVNRLDESDIQCNDQDQGMYYTHRAKNTQNDSKNQNEKFESQSFFEEKNDISLQNLTQRESRYLKDRPSRAQEIIEFKENYSRILESKNPKTQSSNKKSPEKSFTKNISNSTLLKINMSSRKHHQGLNKNQNVSGNNNEYGRLNILQQLSQLNVSNDSKDDQKTQEMKILKKNILEMESEDSQLAPQVISALQYLNEGTDFENDTYNKENAELIPDLLRELETLWDCIFYSNSKRLEFLHFLMKAQTADEFLQRIHLEVDYLQDFSKKNNKFFSLVRRYEITRRKINRIAEAYDNLDQIRSFNRETSSAYLVLRNLNKSILGQLEKRKRGKEEQIEYFGVSFEEKIRVDFWEEEYCKKMEGRIKANK